MPRAPLPARTPVSYSNYNALIYAINLLFAAACQTTVRCLYSHPLIDAD